MSLVPPFVVNDRYEVIEQIGSGGFATVFRAHDRVFERDVAIKVLRDDILSDDALGRFRQEIKVTARLEHAHILHVYDTGEYSGAPFVVMELVPGHTLAERLQRETLLPIPDALSIARDVGLALAHAHRRGIVHRDVKPDNILLPPDGAILADFGIARILSEETSRVITTSGTAVGTVQYMSPEQLCAEPVDARSDQYSLACVLYEMLTGVRPHTSATYAGLRLMRISGQQLPVSSHRGTVSTEISDAVQTALAPVPADRFPDMGSFLDALRLSDGPALSVTPGPQQLVPKSAARKHSRVLLVAGALTVIGTVGALAVIGNGARNARAGGEVRDPALLTVHVDEPGARSNRVDSLAKFFTVALREELSAWYGVRVESGNPVNGPSALYVTPDFYPSGDSVRVVLNVRRAGNATIAPISLRVAMADVRAPQALCAILVRELLLRATAPELSSAEVPGLDQLPERSLQSLKSYVAGFAFYRNGQSDSAAASFQRAAQSATAFGAAELWAAQSGAWSSPTEPQRWVLAAGRALASGTLHGGDSLHAAALQQLGTGRYPESCATYRQLTKERPSSFEAWTGLGDCQRIDSLVVRTASGWQFRSSHWSALRAYQRAVENAPTSQLLAARFPVMLRMTYSDAGNTRRGHSGQIPRDTLLALPSLIADTLAFVPLSSQEFSSGIMRAVPEMLARALQPGRAVALSMTRQWTERFPESPEGWYQRAVALEVNGQIAPGRGEQSAEGALDHAEQLHPEGSTRARIAVTRTRLALRRGDVAEAVRLAKGATQSVDAFGVSARHTLAPLAALLGNASQLVAFSPPDYSDGAGVNASFLDSLAQFSAHAMVGACGALAKSKLHLDSQLRAIAADADYESLRNRWLQPAYRTAVPCLGLDAIRDFKPQHVLDQIVLDLLRGDQAAVARKFAALRAARTGASISSMTWDYLFLESWVLAQSGDSARARGQLVNALNDIERMNRSTLDYPPMAAGLRRGLLLLRQLNVGNASAPSASEQLWVDRAKLLTSTAIEEKKP